MRGDEEAVRRRRFRRGAFRATAMGSKGDGVEEPADDGARGDDGVRSGRRRGAQGGPTRWRLVAAGTGDAGEACGGDGRGVGVVRSRSDLDREGERVGGASG